MSKAILLKKSLRLLLWLGAIFFIILLGTTFLLITFDPWIVKKYLHKKFENHSIIKNFSLDNGRANFQISWSRIRIAAQIDDIKFDIEDKAHFSAEKCQLSFPLLSLIWSTNNTNELSCQNIQVANLQKTDNVKNFDLQVENIFDSISNFFYGKNIPNNILLHNLNIINNQIKTNFNNIQLNIHSKTNYKKIFLQTECLSCEKKQEINSTFFIHKEKAKNFVIESKNIPMHIWGIFDPKFTETSCFFDLNANLNRKDSIVNIDFEVLNIHGKIPNEFLYNDNPWIRINNGSLKGFVNSKKNLQIGDLQVIINNINFNGSGKIDFEEKTANLQINSSETLDYLQILHSMPKTLQQSVFDFYKKSINSGLAKHLIIDLQFQHKNNTFLLEDFQLQADLQKVNFFDDNLQQSFKNLNGKIDISEKKLQVEIQNGWLVDSKINQGKIELDFHNHKNKISGEGILDVASFLQSNIYKEDILIFDERINEKLIGSANANFNFEFQNSKLMNQNVNIVSQDITILEPIKKFSIQDPFIKLDIENEIIKIKGNCLLENESQTTFDYMRNIQTDNSALQLQTSIDLKHLEKIDLLKQMKQQNFFSAQGYAKINLQMSKKNQQYTLNSEIDTTQANFNIDVFAIDHSEDKNSQLIIKNLIINKEKIYSDEIKFTDDENIFDINLEYFRQQPFYKIGLHNRNLNNKNSFDIDLHFQNGSLKINNKAEIINIENFDFQLFNINSEKKSDKKIETIDLQNNITKLLLQNNVKIENFSLHAICNKNQCNTFDLQGMVKTKENNFPIENSMNTREICLGMEDSGIMLQGLGISQNIQQGRIKICINNQFDNFLQQINGKIYIKKFKLYKTPTAMRFFSLVSLSGPLQVLQNQGLTFESLNIPFSYQNSLLTINDAFLSSHGFAVSANGKLNFKQNLTDIDGVVFPMYGINRILVAIPILGDLFAGSGKKRGLIGINYYAKGSIDNPEFSTNPLTIFAPGFIRDLISRKSNYQKSPKITKKFSGVNY